MQITIKSVRRLAMTAGAAAVVLSVCSGVARGDEDRTRIRWDIQHYPNFILQPGGEAFADAADGSKIRLTGSGTFNTDGRDVTGRGTWQTFSANSFSPMMAMYGIFFFSAYLNCLSNLAGS